MKVSELMTRDVLTCSAADSLNRSAQIMWEHDCGCVPVVTPDHVLQGMVTDRDLCMAAYTKGRSLAGTTVGEAMSGRVLSCDVGDDVKVALRRMAEGQVHRLPVVDGQGRLRGLLSLADVVRAFDAEGASERRKHAGELLATMAALTRPRAPRRAERRELVATGA